MGLWNFLERLPVKYVFVNSPSRHEIDAMTAHNLYMLNSAALYLIFLIIYGPPSTIEHNGRHLLRRNFVRGRAGLKKYSRIFMLDSSSSIKLQNKYSKLIDRTLLGTLLLYDNESWLSGRGQSCK